MGGVAKTLGRFTAGMATGGLSEVAMAAGKAAYGGNTATPTDNFGNSRLRTGSGSLKIAENETRPANLLAQTGGAPLLASVIMGADPQEALANYLGVSTKDGSWDKLKSTLNDDDFASFNATIQHLKTIKGDVDLKNKAVQNLVNDFPNVTAQIAQKRAQSGEEFDNVTQGYMKQALDKVGASYAANGSLSSGASAAAMARAGGDMALQKLGYMGDRENAARQDAYTGWQAQMTEANALRGFQQAMLGQGVSQGFSAIQQSLQNEQANQGQVKGFHFQEKLGDQASSNALMGAVGTLGGTALGYAIGGPVGGMIGNSIGGGLFGSKGGATPPSTGGPTGMFDSSGPAPEARLSLYNSNTGYGRYS